MVSKRKGLANAAGSTRDENQGAHRGLSEMLVLRRKMSLRFGSLDKAPNSAA
jgi:hypothetical protein